MQGKISLRNVDLPSRVISRRPWYAIESGLAGLHECHVIQPGASKVAVSVRLRMLLFGRTVMHVDETKSAKSDVAALTGDSSFTRSSDRIV